MSTPTARVFQVRPVQPAQPPAAEAPQPTLLPPPPAAAAAEQAPAAPAAAPEPQAAAAPPAPPAPPPTPDPPYLPRGELTAAPRPLEPINVPFPAGIKGVVDLKVQLTLFIDEQGAVQRVRIDTPGVVEDFEQAIRETFARARFQPGEIDKVAVRSQVRIEVEFSTAGKRPP
ncbi:MAG: TonB family protein [Ramlibacter sp.]